METTFQDLVEYPDPADQAPEFVARLSEEHARNAIRDERNGFKLEANHNANLARRLNSLLANFPVG